MWSFIPEDTNMALQVPYFEDARSDYAPYYRSAKTIKTAMNEVIAEMGKLNASITAFTSGKFEVHGQERCGYVIEFLLRGMPGVIRVAGLPIKVRYNAEEKEKKARVQCLLNVRDWLKAAVTMQVFSPDTSPLLLYLLVDGKRTLAEYTLEGGQFTLPEPTKVEILD